MVEGFITKSTYMPRGARDYEKTSPSDIEQSCVLVDPEGEPTVVLRRVPLGSLHYKQAIIPASTKKSTNESSDRL